MGLFRRNAGRPVLYTEQELSCLEFFIEEHYGAYTSVFHELVSPDIHVDIAIIPPSPDRMWTTLVTMGMGAYRMKVPSRLKKDKRDRAELLICLPPHWEVESDEEKWYWPLRWLKILARLPGSEKSWLGRGHTVPGGGPFAGNTALSSLLLDEPQAYGEEAAFCPLPDGSGIRFYQVIPLYEEERQYQLAHGLEALCERFGGAFPRVLDPHRENCCRQAVHI